MKLPRSYAETLFGGGEEVFKSFCLLHFLIYYYDESSLAVALF